MRPSTRALLLALAACGPSGGRDSASASTSSLTGDLTGGTGGTTAAPPTTGGPGETSTGSGGPADPTTTTGEASTTGDASSGAPPKLDVGPDTGVIPPCSPEEDLCCKQDGQLPPHALLDAFLATYPPPAMPKTVADVQAFAPVADGHAMAWSDENVGGELVDAANGGVIAPNVEAGRALARAAAEAALPAGATLLEAREDPVIIEDLGGAPPCVGVGWAWGSLLFEAPDLSIGQLVYLYIGYCAQGDVEVFYYSDQAVELCPPPG